MKIKCKTCGFEGEALNREGKCYCSACGSEIEGVAAPATVVVEGTSAVTETLTDKETCPICKNTQKNILKGNKCVCALCGTEFTPAPKSTGSTAVTAAQSKASSVDEAKKAKDQMLLLGVVFLFLFWPVSLYFFYKWYNMK